MRVLVITRPDPVVSLADAKAHCKVEDDSEDALIKAYVAAATSHIDGPDGWLGRALGVQVLEARCGAACGDTIRLPFPPVVELVSISYLDADGVEQMGDLADVEVLGRDLVAASSWPWVGGSSRREAVRIRYRAGYPVDDSGDSPRSTLPAAIRAAILLMTDDLYRNRGTVSPGTVTAVPMSTPVENLLAPFRVYA
ncbi:phage gp6-like head-tail connector protein [Sphingomonas sp. HHU CXW]|uniref:Phage gp6-like head-tail connector protein n=1 Tax=Sphingomonas hominis TaxID=2741495 RepID=A0ABX2JD94_9SPHN|nr:head-tail connector protein [Sphingomonas hominis]NTS64161.1 phage gp6-like head-tail connector protein [Sphingomonas hominis]